MTKHDKHHFVYLATVERLNASEIKGAMNLKVSTETIYCTLKRNPYVHYTKLLAAPVLNTTHKQNHLEFAEQHI